VRGDTDADRFWPKVDQTADCWLWIASTTRTGVGQFLSGSSMVQAHRFARALLTGQSPDGVLRHACGNLRCIRPDPSGPQARVGVARPPEVRFLSNVEVHAAGCWFGEGPSRAIAPANFEDYDVDGARHLAHRFAWRLTNGEIPPDHDVVHNCGTRLCVRPDRGHPVGYVRSTGMMRGVIADGLPNGRMPPNGSLIVRRAPSILAP
jgi:hypothetical protein